MNYGRWGDEYLNEAEELKKRADTLQEKLKTAAGEEKVLLFRRISMLYTMHLECLHTGYCLKGRGMPSEKCTAESGSDEGDAGRRTVG